MFLFGVFGTVVVRPKFFPNIAWVDPDSRIFTIFSNVFSPLFHNILFGIVFGIVFGILFTAMNDVACAIRFRAYKQAEFFEQRAEYYRLKNNKLRSTTLG